MLSRTIILTYGTIVGSFFYCSYKVFNYDGSRSKLLETYITGFPFKLGSIPGISPVRTYTSDFKAY
nr:MAG TPA: hypothetical protein [Caudoviricetes sp.]